jgi:putrescine importer
LSQVQATGPTQRLNRVLHLWDLIYYGIILISPIAAVPLFGVAQQLSHGHAVTTLLAAMAAMTLTAASFGRMATIFPSAGSAYAYTSRGLNPHVGFLVGWAMFLEYLVQPIQNSIYGALTIQRFLPRVPFAVVAAGFLGLITFLNLRGIRSTARTNQLLVYFMGGVIVTFVLLAIRYLYIRQGWHGLFSIQPIYNPSTFQVRPLATGTSLAALTYIGFDGVSILAEEAEKPRRDVLLASVLVCIFTGLFSGLQVYLAQRVWPDYRNLANPETAFMDVGQVVGGALLFGGLGVMLIVSSFGCGLAGHVGAARLLFSMGRDNVIPGAVFGYVHPESKIPTYNVWIIGAVSYAATLLIGWQRAAELLNFGAFLAFMGVNLATIRYFYFTNRAKRKPGLFKDLLLPGFGFLFCFVIWLTLETPAKTLGGLWLGIGLIYIALRTRGFQLRPAMIEFGESSAGSIEQSRQQTH